MIYDYSKRIILKNWKEFLSNFVEEDIILFECKAVSSGEFSKSELRLLFDPSIAELIEDEDILKLICKEHTLIFNGSDFKWWCQDNRANKLFSSKREHVPSQKKEKTQETKDSDEQTTVKICEMKHDEATNVAEFSGTKKACLQFINQRYYVYVLRARSNDAVRLDINNSGWKTFSQLKEDGVIE